MYLFIYVFIYSFIYYLSFNVCFNLCEGSVATDCHTISQGIKKSIHLSIKKINNQSKKIKIFTSIFTKTKWI